MRVRDLDHGPPFFEELSVLFETKIKEQKFLTRVIKLREFSDTTINDREFFDTSYQRPRVL